MTKHARITNNNLSFQKRASAPKVQTWLSFIKHGPAMNISLAGVLVVMGMTYLGIVNSTAADTVKLHQLSTAIDKTQTANRDLELDITEVLSLQHVDAMSERYELVAATDVEYVTANDAAVALSQ